MKRKCRTYIHGQDLLRLIGLPSDCSIVITEMFVENSGAISITFEGDNPMIPEVLDTIPEVYVETHYEPATFTSVLKPYEPHPLPDFLKDLVLPGRKENE